MLLLWLLLQLADCFCFLFLRLLEQLDLLACSLANCLTVQLTIALAFESCCFRLTRDDDDD